MGLRPTPMSSDRTRLMSNSQVSAVARVEYVVPPLYIADLHGDAINLLCGDIAQRGTFLDWPTRLMCLGGMFAALEPEGLPQRRPKSVDEFIGRCTSPRCRCCSGMASHTLSMDFFWRPFDIQVTGGGSQRGRRLPFTTIRQVAKPLRSGRRHGGR